METNRVVITLHKGTDVLGFMAEMSQLGHTSPYVPNRAVEIANPKHDSLYNVDFTMTHDEFLRIQQDPRVRAARWGSKADNGIVIKITAQDAAQPLYRNPGTWNTNQDGNWGRAACSNIGNPFPPTNNPSSSIASFVRNYTLDGSGVDVVIMDDGIEATHPDWNDASGNTRLHLVDWFAAPLVTSVSTPDFQTVTYRHTREPAGPIPPGTYVAIEGTFVPEDYQSYRVRVVASDATSTTVQYDSPRSGPVTGGGGYIYWFPERGGEVTGTTGFYTDTSGHGTNVTSIAMGRRYGWATGADIYFINIYKLVTTNAANLIRIWHNNKPVGENGLRRPTVVNASFTAFFQQNAASSNLIVGYNYRNRGNVLLAYNSTNGVNYSTVGLLGSAATFPGYIYSSTDQLPLSVASLDSDIEDAIDSGVIVIAAAANDYYKIDIPGGVDYNNFAIISNTTVSEASRVYYHQGSSPNSARGVITVGAVAATYFISSETKAPFSRTGPGVDVWAPGQSIAGACSNISSLGAAPTSTYPEDTRYRTAKVTGTSQAAPQVTGVVATLLQARPWLNQDGIREAILQTSVPGRVANATSTGGYTDIYSLQTSAGRYLRTPFTNNIVSNLSLGGTTDISGSF